ncbi:tRNA (N(6)-L-threonylcarbamoyladenosine(37)-C(2))-methylthiotransferase MtaB [Sulfurimonas sp. MAG313]|nr:tRNA (N(6)-L-threonylcarbamoyladenosine(37)-C(2))-methylthiotransferase MtaB [Sulfurimonas sp. MAG313]MDF1881410.1 tRNA (N(6)-L-threonylcarbamoyladenosine(37)-C(2))-methylthiotransferase MtaB [Sulfurimonas sp. MAG313]
MSHIQKVFIKTFGCRTNLFDSQVMLAHLEDFEVTQNEDEADIVIVNSCTVTNGADSGVRGYVNSANKKGAKVYLTGCGAHTKGESLFEGEKVFGVFGQSEKAKINELLKEKERFYQIGDLDFIDETVVEDFVGKSRAFIKVQEGCNFRCSYCIIPFVRGDARSHDEEKIVEQITRLAQNGFGEFILTGTNVGSYGQGVKRTMAGLLKRISLIQGVRRIRIGSMEPIQITDEFKELLSEPWLEKHLHIAIQHSSQEMLRIMNRRNNVDTDIKLINELHDKGFAVGTDFIVGHPGETDALWSEAMKNLNQMPLTHVHAFTYSKRDGTPSALLKGDINGLVSKQRMGELTSLIDENNYRFRLAHKVALDVLIESEKEGLYTGLDQFFNKIEVSCPHDLSGNWITIEDYEVKEDMNYAQL